ncbi:sigma-70 family RNA polymerase sigma factor [Arenibacter troitsensis]|uniref:RNA polymerase sigma-70 factor, ECF subfamily n=1 Tax=Arenibacter troitsensis TaxID=188872 RepID=A0A1X7KEF4_9FLAO|nr:sigma-70 family RNA polymerase sigma factor [Arenibacter troitsensis]SMG39262.1 RNA polymerase sigma-70 factor, ECF subfamily [Arenibacter troitsensis]
MAKNKQNCNQEMEHLFKEHFPMLCLIAFGIVKDKDLAKDIVQDFYMSYWQRREAVAITISFKAYAIKAVKNMSLLCIEKAKKEKSLLQSLNTPQYNDPEPMDPPNTNGRKIQALINELPESRKQIFISAIINGRSYAEIAEMQGISINTVKTQMKRAYAFLRSEATENLLHFFLWAALFSYCIT